MDLLSFANRYARGAVLAARKITNGARPDTACRTIHNPPETKFLWTRGARVVRRKRNASAPESAFYLPPPAHRSRMSARVRVTRAYPGVSAAIRARATCVPGSHCDVAADWWRGGGGGVGQSVMTACNSAVDRKTLARARVYNNNNNNKQQQQQLPRVLSFPAGCRHRRRRFSVARRFGSPGRA